MNAAPIALAAAVFALLSYYFPAVARALVAASLILFWMAVFFLSACHCWETCDD